MTTIASCVSFCETTNPHARTDELDRELARACWEAGFPTCERVYAGSYFCENYFLGLSDPFHEAVRNLCRRYEMGATLVIPLVGQAFLSRADRRIDEVLERFCDVYDEIVVNDVAQFLHLSERTGARIGVGRLFSKTRRDARYPEVFDAIDAPELSPEALACIAARPLSPLVELDPTCTVVDATRVLEAVPDAEIALHLPYCYATTGRNCSFASIDEPDEKKFRIGRTCAHHCLRMAQGSRVQAGVRYVKRGRTYFYPNPACRIAGTERWRIVYART